MSTQTIRGDVWEACLPEAWTEASCNIAGTSYFEAPDHACGVYLASWQVQGNRLLDAMRVTRRVELKHLPGDQAHWVVVGKSESAGGAETEVVTEYFDRSDSYRIISRLLGHHDYYVRLVYHDYDCNDLATSNERSEPVVRSLRLRKPVGD